MGNRFTSTTRETGAGLTENNPLTVIIPVAGMGYRMKSYGPKCLLKANQQQTILQKTIKNIESEYPFSDIIVVAGFEADKIINALPHKIRVVENQNYEEAANQMLDSKWATQTKNRAEALAEIMRSLA